MQTAAPEVMDIRGETAQTLRLYGVEAGRPSFAANCLLARRLVERGVRYVQRIHTDWDHRGGRWNLDRSIEGVSYEVHHARAGLCRDLKRRGMLNYSQAC